MATKTTKQPTVTVLHGDCWRLMRDMPDNSVDLAICSPPYEDARLYNIGFNLRGKEWVDWALPRYLECHRVSRGLVAWVIAGKTRNFSWSGVPFRLAVELMDAGVKLRAPGIFVRHGIPGSGGPDYWRVDNEFIITSAKGKLPWSDNTACGHPPKYRPGGAMSHQSKKGRVNKDKKAYKPPKLANPGNVLRGAVGKGHMGSDLAHQNEAPFPEWLVERYIKSFCPPDGIVLDPFSGSGSTAAVAVRLGRNAIAIDVRESQCNLTRLRTEEITNADG